MSMQPNHGASMTSEARGVDLLALAARCEGAAGADREIDLAIAVALDLRPDWLSSQQGELWIDRSGTYPVLRFADARFKRSPGNPSVDDPRKFTASLDAAMTLVPEGAWWMVEGGSTGGASACVGTPEEVFAATPALALCAAALRARHQSAAGEG